MDISSLPHLGYSTVAGLLAFVILEGSAVPAVQHEYTSHRVVSLLLLSVDWLVEPLGVAAVAEEDLYWGDLLPLVIGDWGREVE